MSGHVRYAPKAEAITEHQQFRDKPSAVDVTALDVIQAPKLEPALDLDNGTDLPVDGQISELVVQSHLQKYLPSGSTQIKSISIAIPSHRGAFRDRHGRWARDAVDAAALGAQRDGRAGFP